MTANKTTYLFMKPICITLVFITFFLSCSAFGQASTQKLLSPDGKLRAIFSLDAGGTPRYALYYKNNCLISDSEMGFVLRFTDSITQFKCLAVHNHSVNEIWYPVWGISNRVENHCNEMKLELECLKQNIRMNVYFRCYNDGFAFRYEFPEQDYCDSIIITSEETRFRFSGKWESWWSQADYNSYEKLYNHTVISDAKHVATPFTLKKQQGPYICLHEAALVDYSSMTLKQELNNENAYKIDLVPWSDATLVKTVVPALSPWRVVFVADNAGDLMTSQLLYNLNEACVLDDVSWITPMTYLGIWWEMHLGISDWKEGPRHGATTENAKRYIDFASEHQIGGFLAEGWNTGWDKWGQPGAFDYITPASDFDLAEVLAYSHNKQVDFIGHHETGGDIPGYEAALDTAFALYRSLGVHAVKTGYAGAVVPAGEYHHGQYKVNHCNDVMRKAAEYKLMINTHEAVMMSGLSRTYPNLMTAEVVRGMEWNAWSEGNSPSHTCVLPFTRCIAGPVDYTAGIFDADYSTHSDKRVRWNGLDNGNTSLHATVANQLALMLVLYSPMQMAADMPENYENHEAFRFVERLPTSFDHSEVPHAKIGEYVVVARCKNSEWFVGGITNETQRSLKLKFRFLNKNTPYWAFMVFDANTADFQTNPEAYEVVTKMVNSNTKQRIRLAPGGGFVMILSPVKK